MNSEIIYRTGVDTRPFQTGMRSLTSIAKGTAHNIRAAFAQSDLGQMLSVAGIIGMASKLANMADEIKGTSDALDVSTDFLQGWRQSVDQNSGSVEAANKGLENFSVLVGEAAQGSDEAQKKITKLGVSLVDVNGHVRKTDDILLDVAEALKNTESGSDRAAIAAELFGKKVGIQLIPTLMQGRDALRAMIDETKKLSADEINAVADAQDRLKKASDNVVVGLGKVVGWVSFAAEFWGAYSVRGVSAAQAMDMVANSTHKATDAISTLKSKAAEALDVQNAKDFAAAMERLHSITRRRYMDNLSLEEQTVTLWSEHARLEKEVSEMEKTYKKDDVALVEKLTALNENELAIEKNHGEWVQFRLKQEKLITDQKEKQAKLSDLSKLTIEELASNQTPEGKLSPDKAKARSVMDLRAQAEQLRLQGDSEGALNMMKKANQIITGRPRSEMTPQDLQDEDWANWLDSRGAKQSAQHYRDKLNARGFGGIDSLKDSEKKTDFSEATKELQEIRSAIQSLDKKIGGTH